MSLKYSIQHSTIRLETARTATYSSRLTVENLCSITEERLNLAGTTVTKDTSYSWMKHIIL